jgi:hypothetical protein
LAAAHAIGACAFGTKDVESDDRGKRTARAPSRTFNIGSAWDEFDFLPPELVSACGVLVKRYHAQQAQLCKWPVEIVWRTHADELLRQNRTLRALFVRACRTRRSKPAKERQQNIAALILACETLVWDESGWGARFPEAKQKAEQLFGKVSKRRAWLSETYGWPAMDEMLQQPQ